MAVVWVSFVEEACLLDGVSVFIFQFFTVTPRHVLFAAHCIQDKQQEGKLSKKASESYFYFKNDYDADDESTKAEVSEFIVHPDWDPEEKCYTADIAIAVLKEPMKLTNKIRHVCLNTPSNPIQNFAGRNASVYGWGLTEELETVSELHHVDVPLVDQVLCNSSNPNIPKIMSDTSFCAGARDGRTGPCNGNFLRFYKQRTNRLILLGDSGGGMVLEVNGLWKIVGIVSAAVGKSTTVYGKNTSICDLNHYLVYTDVSKFYKWIDQVVFETY